ncbi:energy transducer TonB (plasmid) [Paracoccus sp. TK19116]|uniref:Energy transducer TonB n=1 Tax=Paracoccus albicereus TaxID=2922394 RepID=A0ABT1MKT0_9RHOB|nr:energy transducer TonB [Paracoccus albicereus]MCQ0968905.1 energy transducer TonB [Paracoccus albicereus]
MIPRRKSVAPCVALALSLAVTLPAVVGPAAAQTQFGSIETMRPADMQEWGTLLSANVHRQAGTIAGSMSNLTLTEPVELSFSLTVDPSGTIVSGRVVDSSGYGALDEAALRLVRNMPPMPAFTPDMPQEPLTFRQRITIQR